MIHAYYVTPSEFKITYLPYYEFFTPSGLVIYGEQK